MRFRLPMGRRVFFGGAFLFALLALLPLRLALDWLDLDARGVAAREAKGSIWRGALSEAQIGRVPLGDLRTSLRGLPLFAGRARLDLERRDEANRFEGAVSVSRHAFGVDDLTAKLDLGGAVAPLPLASVDLNDVSARFADGLCSSAEGGVKATIVGDVAGLALPGGLSGNARCDGGALLLPLVSQTGTETLHLRVYEDGRYAIQFAVVPGDDAMRDRLIAAGFRPGPGGYVLAARGSF